MSIQRIKQMRVVFEDVREESSEYLRNMDAIKSSSDCYEHYKYLANEVKEQFIALHLDSKNKIICQDIVSVGSLNASIVHPREVFKSAMLSSAAALLFIHNHPSGDPEPSREDIELTNRLKQGAELLGIRILDHIVIGNGRYHSFADRGLI